jgi:8-amino-7-oxononanoate synthase
MVDDAHATGVLGKNGAGTVEYFGLKGRIDIQMGTLSKALASEGGYIAGKKNLIEYLKHNSKSFIYSTALAPHIIAVSLKSLELIKEHPELRTTLIENSEWFQDKLQEIGFKINRVKTPIIPLMIGESDTAMELSRMLFEEGIYIPAIRPPTVQKGTSRLRITLMATHTREDLTQALEVIKKQGKKLKLI